jgi:hypothetical protein
MKWQRLPIMLLIAVALGFKGSMGKAETIKQSERQKLIFLYYATFTDLREKLRVHSLFFSLPSLNSQGSSRNGEQ